MRWIGSLFGVLVGLGFLLVAARLLGLGDLLRDSIAAGHLLDWAMGALCLLWLLALLKAPWDLFFDAHAAAFEQQRSRERGIAVPDDRQRYVATVRARLLALAIGAHLFSAGLVAAISFWTREQVGYWFAAFFLISTFFRPAIAGYVYLSRRLRALIEEASYPREDVVELRLRLTALEDENRRLAEEARLQNEALGLRDEARQREIDALRGRLNAIGAEFEAAASRFTDQKAVIDGLQAIARLIARSAAG